MLAGLLIAIMAPDYSRDGWFSPNPGLCFFHANIILAGNMVTKYIEYISQAQSQLGEAK